MNEKAFGKIEEGLREAVAVARGETEPPRTIEVRPMTGLEELLERNRKLIGLLQDAYHEIAWNQYNTGIERDGKWMDAGLRDAEELQSEMGLEPGWHDAKAIRLGIHDAVSRRISRALSDTKEA